ncbi:hypothetical protein M3O40_17575 [Xanthomonas nasturtii]|uniref:hypothetical protein n=1 Tax=Xanthomonas nasturtii TaxID=1843581 RepID=UPI002011C883|nr:hypothetical protein [Xanthomonas nasturtii]MCL1500773.1 hypothetical protein [Xanthomonas nasturtii]MCL1504880.1 hypothetical protein [Xanthomonas nasturtii]
MQKQKKRHGASRGALIKPNREVPCQHDNGNAHLALPEFPEFPLEVWRNSAAYSLDQASRARDLPQLKHYLRQWVIRQAFAMRGVHSNWPEYAWSVFDSAATASGIRVRFRREDIRAVCRMADRIARGEG